MSIFFLFRWFQILSCGAQKRDCKHHKLTGQTPSLIHVNPHRNPDSPKSTSLILLIIHLSLQYSLTFMFQTFPMTVLSRQRCMTDFVDKMKKILWDFKFHEPLLPAYIIATILQPWLWRKQIKSPRNGFFKKLTYLAFLLTFDLTHLLNTVQSINFAPCYSFYSPSCQGTLNRILPVAKYLE